MKEHNTCAIILAAGEGRRMGLDRPKQELQLLGKSVLRHTLEAFSLCEDIASIVVVTREDEMEFARGECCGIEKLHTVTLGGRTRALSAARGFAAVPAECDFVAVHDAARCLITPEMISKVVKNAYIYGAASAATAATDTVKIVDTEGFVVSTPQRKSVMLASTPQVFSTYIYNKAISGVDLSGENITDDNMLVEATGTRVYCTEVGRENMKITTRSDVLYAELLLGGRDNGEI